MSIVLQMLPSLFPRGVELDTIEISKGLKKTNYSPIVLSSGGPLAVDLTSSNIEQIFINSLSQNPFTIWKNAKIISALIKERNVDIVHAVSRASAWSCYMAAKSKNKKFITTFHGLYDTSNFIKHAYSSIMTKGDMVIAVSEYVKQHIINYYGIAEQKISVIHPGLDLNHFDPQVVDFNELDKLKSLYNIPLSVPVILLPGKVTAWKGHVQLIDALHSLKHLDFYCLIVGDLSKHHEFSKSLQQKISELKLQKKVQIYGHQKDLVMLYAMADIVLSIPIAPEAFGRSVIEGQAMKKIVIATHIGGANETIQNEVNGYHVAPNNIEDLAKKISYCLSILGSSKALEISENARNSVIKNFSSELMIQKTIKVYSQLI